MRTKRRQIDPRLKSTLLFACSSKKLPKTIFPLPQCKNSCTTKSCKIGTKRPEKVSNYAGSRPTDPDTVDNYTQGCFASERFFRFFLGGTKHSSLFTKGSLTLYSHTLVWILVSRSDHAFSCPLPQKAADASQASNHGNPQLTAAAYRIVWSTPFPPKKLLKTQTRQRTPNHTNFWHFLPLTCKIANPNRRRETTERRISTLGQQGPLFSQIGKTFCSHFLRCTARWFNIKATAGMRFQNTSTLQTITTMVWRFEEYTVRERGMGGASTTTTSSWILQAAPLSAAAS